MLYSSSLPSACGVYAIVSEITGAVYVGSSFNVRGRTISHLRLLRDKKHSNWKLNRDVKRYGVDQFKAVLLELCDKEEKIAREQHWIDKLEAVDRGYNVARVAQGEQKYYTAAGRQRLIDSRTGRTHSLETRKKISAAGKGRILSKEHVEKVRKALLGKRGFKHSDETRLKMSLGHQGVPKTQEVKDKISLAHRGRKRPEADKESMRKGWIKRKAKEQLARQRLQLLDSTEDKRALS